jgi:hypothetical protein
VYLPSLGLTFGCPSSWRPYLLTVATAGVLTSLDVGLALCSYLYVGVTFIMIMKATTPCWQLLFSVALGMEKARPELVAVVLLIGSGVGLAAAGDLQFRWTGFALLLSSAALAGLRGCLLQRVLHGYDVGLLIRKQQVHPVQLVYALAPWTTLTALITTLVLERDFLIFFLELHSPHLRLFTLR